MASSVNYEPQSIIEIKTDSYTVVAGAVSRGAYLELGENSKCYFLYTFDTVSKKLRTSDLRLRFDMLSDQSDLMSRYIDSAQINIKIQYMKEVLDSNNLVTGYVDGAFENYQVFPYYNHETDGFIKYVDMEVPNDYIKSIKIEVVNNTAYTIKYNYIWLFYGVTTKEAITGSFGFAIGLKEVIAYSDGCELYFDNDSTPTKMWWQEDASGNLSGVNVNKEKLIKFSRVNTILID